MFEFKHEVVDNRDVFYLARFAGGPISLGGVDAAERSVLQDWRWWSAAEIEASIDPIYPPDLASVVRALDMERVIGSTAPTDDDRLTR